MRQTAADILAAQEVSQVMLVNRTAGRNDVPRAAVRPTAPVNPSVKIAVNVSAYQFMSTFLVILPINIFDLSLGPLDLRRAVMRIRACKEREAAMKLKLVVERGRLRWAPS